MSGRVPPTNAFVERAQPILTQRTILLDARLRELAPHPGEAVAALEICSSGAMPG